MKKRITSTIHRTLGALGALAVVICLTSLSGCNTWKGVGKDVERTGEAMQGD